MRIGEITVVSAADESSWPKDLGGTLETKASKKNVVLKMANWGEMGRYGQKDVMLESEGNGDSIRLNFQATGVKQPLVAVR